MEIEKPTTHDLRDTLEVEVERDLNLNDSDFEGPTMPREAGGLEDQTGYYEVPCCTCLSYEFWNRWFRVDTIDVGERLIKSLLFFNKSLVESIKTVPDLYGPFWIYTTLGFMLGISANLDKYIANKDEKNRLFEFDFLQIGRALFFIYFVGFLAPISVSIFLRSSGQRVYPVKLITIYGYAYFIYLIATCVALVPSNLIKMIAMGYAGVTSLIHILISFSHETKKQTTSLRVLLIICIYVAVSQPIILLIIKENYFHHIKYGV